MSAAPHTGEAAVLSETEKEQRIFNYSAHYGQRPETEERYHDAIQACQSIENLPLTVSEIARMYGLEPESLRNQLKRHFPDIIPKRNALRSSLGYAESTNSGLKKATIERYAAAIELLRDSGVTVREAADRCGVSYYGLQQHLLFYHKDIAESRMLVRVDALLKPVKVGEPTASGGIRAPSPEAEALYAPAVAIYRSTDLPLTEIARRCGLKPHNLGSYMRKWHREDIDARKARRAAGQKQQQAEESRKCRSAAALARKKYAPALDMLRQGASFREAASAAGCDTNNLRVWVEHNYPDLAREVIAANMVDLPEGTRCQRESWELFKDAVEAYCNTSEPLSHIAGRNGLRITSLRAFLVKHFPKAVAARRRAEADKRQARKQAWLEKAKPTTD